MVRSRGFTLPEMLTVLMIVGILAAIAFPAMNKFLVTQAVRSASYDLFADLIYARSEAIARGTTVTVIGTGKDDKDYKLGYRVRENGAGTTLREQPARDSEIEFKASQSEVTFDRSGRATSQVLFNITPGPQVTNPNDDMKRCIRLDPSGRPKSSEGACS